MAEAIYGKKRDFLTRAWAWIARFRAASPALRLAGSAHCHL
jgi:hypothetical protein